jgi:hypothetical protein
MSLISLQNPLIRRSRSAACVCKLPEYFTNYTTTKCTIFSLYILQPLHMFQPLQGHPQGARNLHLFNPLFLSAIMLYITYIQV